MLLDNGRTRVLARRGRPAGAALHPLQRLPQRLPRLLAHRRPRLRLGLPGPDRRDPDAAARRDRERAVAARSHRASAAPATRSARSRSTSRRVLLHLRAQAVAATATARASARRCAPSRWMFGGARRFALAQRLGAARCSGRSSAAGAIRRLPGPLAAGRSTRDLQAVARAELPRVVEASGDERARDARSSARVRAALGGTRRPEPVAARLPAARHARAAARVALFCERVGDYRAECAASRPARSRRRSRRSAASAARAGSSSRRAARRVAPAGRRARRGRRALAARELDALDGVVTGCTVAIAETGTIVLAGGPRARAAARSRSSPTCTSASSRSAQIVELVPEAIALARASSCDASAGRSRFDLGPVGDLRHRAQPRRGRARPPQLVVVVAG